MLRAAAVSMVLLVSSSVAADDRPPVPSDASAPAPTKGGGDRIGQYVIPRGLDAVAAEERKLLVDGGWTITRDEKVPATSAIRIETKKKGPTWKLSLSGDKLRTTILVTAPATP